MEKMIEILKVEKDKKKFIVKTSEGEYKFTEDIIVNYLVLKGKTFTEKEFKKIIKENGTDELFNKALNYISYQQRSEYEIYSYLKEKGAESTEITKIIKKIKDFGYINDEALANYLLEYATLQKKGPKFLEKKLQEKRIAQDTINKTLLKYDEVLEREVVEILASKLVTKNTDKPVKVQKAHIYEKMMRDGFSSDVISYVINNLEFCDNSLDHLEKEIEKLQYKYRDLDEYKRKEKIIASLLRKGYDYSIVTKYL